MLTYYDNYSQLQSIEKPIFRLDEAVDCERPHWYELKSMIL